MKRSQVDEENCGHWEYEVPHPVAHLEGGTLEQSLMPRNFGTTTRRSRILRASSRDFTAGMTLVGMASRVDETYNILQQARLDVPALVTGEQGFSRRTSLTEVGTNEKPSGSHECNGSVTGGGYGVLDTTEDPMFDVHEDQFPGTEARAQSVVDELSQTLTSNSLPELVSGAATDESKQDHGEDVRDKENRDPLGGWFGLPHRSPLPEWFPRIPLQDITNVLARDPDDEQPEPKKKRNKKMGTTLAPTLLTRHETPIQKVSTIAQPKPFSCATSKQAYNLRKNFR